MGQVNTKGAYINGIGTAVPTRMLDQDETIKISEMITRGSISNKVISKLVTKSSIDSRFVSCPIYAEDDVPQLAKTWSEDLNPSTSVRMKLYEEVAPVLALEASIKALSQSKLTNQEITHLITVTCTGFYAPGIDFSLIKELNLSSKISRVQVGFLGCHAAINAIAVANAIVKSDPAAKVLLVAAEVCSAHVSFSEQALVPNIIFSDGAAALVVSSQQLNEDDLFIQTNHSFLVPDSHNAMNWNIGDHGFEMYLSPELPMLIEKNVGGWIHDTLKLSPSDFLWAIHPGGIRVLQATQKALGLSDDAIVASKEVLSSFGNMSSPTVIFILEKLLSVGKKEPIFMVGFGPGLFCEGVILNAH